MPRIELITKVLHEPLEPYHVDYDNLPLKGIIERINLVNSSLDSIEELVNSAKGVQENFASRINQSLEENGNLKSSKVNDTLHNIAYHTDGSLEGIEYCRFKLTERNKLNNISDNAKNISFEIAESPSVIVFNDGILKIANSETINCEFNNPNILKFNLNFDSDSLHLHYYNVIPIHANELEPDYTNYSLPVVFKEDTIRIYINGIKISETGVYVYNNSIGPSGNWFLTSFTINEDLQSFTLSRSISEDDEILVDFDCDLN